MCLTVKKVIFVPMKRLLDTVLICSLLISCDSGNQDIAVFSYTFDFSIEKFDWAADFADYPENSSATFELQSSYGLLPETISKTRKGLMVSGNNHSSDLFMFIKKKITGLSPGTTYNVLFNVRFASNAPTGIVGAGGSPGEGVTVKVGASVTEPDKVVTLGVYRMNIDKGNQAIGGKDMFSIGNVGVAATTTQFTEVYRNNNLKGPFKVTTDNQGEVWVIVGTDSGFAGITTLYYTNIDIVFNKAN